MSEKLAGVARSTSHAIDANGLREIAEWADGARGTEFYLSANALRPDNTRGPGLVPVDEKTPPPDDAIRVHTKRIGKPMPRTVTLVAPSGTSIDLPVDKYDSVFWGESAAEKFLVPYYVRFYGDARFQMLRAAIRSGEVIAIAHWYPTIYDEIVDPDGLHVLADTAQFTAGFVPLSTWFASRQ